MGLFKKSVDFLNSPIDLSAFNPNTRRGDSRVEEGELMNYVRDEIICSFIIHKTSVVFLTGTRCSAYRYNSIFFANHYFIYTTIVRGVK